MARISPVSLYRGDTWSRVWSPKDPSGVPIDLTGATARLHLRDKVGALVLEASTANGRLVIAPGTITLEVAFADMELPPGTYRFDLEVTYASGRRRTYEVNVLVVLEDVSHG